MAETTPRRLVLVGGGGHAKVILEILRAASPPWDIVGIVDASPDHRGVLGVRVLGDDSVLPSLRADGVDAAFVAIGENGLRQNLAVSVRDLGFELVNAISPAATLSPSAKLGRGVAIMAGAVINAEAEIGDLSIINTGALVDHDVQVGEAAHIAPGCAIAGNVAIGERALIGVGARLLPGITIGEDATIGGGACVTQDIAARATAVGIPARVISTMTRVQR